MSIKVTLADLKARYNEMTLSLVCRCRLATELVGGLPADEEGLRAFVKHHLGLEGAEAEEAYIRISTEEIEDVSITPENGEVDERLTYGVRAIRKSENGPWLGNWMLKACFKQAFSLADVFTSVRRSKAYLAEGGMVEAYGQSLKEPDHPERIYLLGDGELYFQKFHGRVRVGNTLKSIVHHSECAPPGMEFEFRVRMIRGELKDQDLIDVMPLAMTCGLGSARSLERGKFDILEADIVDAAKPREKVKKETKEAKPKKGKKGEAEATEPELEKPEVEEPVAA